MYKKSEISPIVFILFISIIFLNSCDVKQASPQTQPSPVPVQASELEDRSWLTDQSCRAPCWHDLTLGATSMSTAREKAVQLPFVDTTTIKVKGNSLFLYCKQPEQKLCTTLYFTNDLLTKIWMNIYYPMSLEEVVNTIGAPDFLSYRPITPNKAIAGDCLIELFWIDRQMTIKYFNYNNNDMCNGLKVSGNKPSPTLPVHEVWYLMPDYFSDINIEDEYYPWTGFAEDD